MSRVQQKRNEALPVLPLFIAGRKLVAHNDLDDAGLTATIFPEMAGNKRR
jgi:hypothetical protein